MEKNTFQLISIYLLQTLIELVLHVDLPSPALAIFGRVADGQRAAVRQDEVRAQVGYDGLEAALARHPGWKHR